LQQDRREQWVLPMGFGGDNDAALGNVNDVITEGFGHRVQRHGTIDKSLDKFEANHFLAIQIFMCLISRQDQRSGWFPDRTVI
jgi:hypothetical protein